MAYKKTLADNHLSEGALGRFGDTKMHTTKHVRPGSDWHVNPQEKQLMNMYGAKGEKLVDSIGSGTINPYTGKEEKWLPLAISIASLALGGIQSHTGGKARNAQAASQARLSQLEIDEASKAQEALDPAKESKELVAQEEYNFGLEGLSSQTGIAKEDLNKQMNTAIQKSGLATSGTIEGNKSQMWKRIQSTFSRGQEGLMGQLGKAMGGIEEWYEGEKSRLGGVIKRATLQKKAYQKQSDSWYLGKNIGL
jgi:hypothetical protein